MYGMVDAMGIAQNALEPVRDVQMMRDGRWHWYCPFCRTAMMYVNREDLLAMARAHLERMCLTWWFPWTL